MVTLLADVDEAFSMQNQNFGEFHPLLTLCRNAKKKCLKSNCAAYCFQDAS